DLIFAYLCLFISLPIWFMVILVIWLEDGIPFLYLQDRVGKDELLFKNIKFRSMFKKLTGDSILSQASENDARTTKIGSLLRATAIDELPQLINIIRGEMSFVGPRALMPVEKELHMNEAKSVFDFPDFKDRCTIRVGLTGVAQVFAPRDIERECKFKYDLWYIKNRNFMLDLFLIFLSFLVSLEARWETRSSKFCFLGSKLKKKIEQDIGRFDLNFRKNMKIKILLLNVNSKLGGAERSLLTEVFFLNKDIFDPIVGVLYEGPLTEEFAAKNIPYHIFNVNSRFLRLSQENMGLFFLWTVSILISSIKLARDIANFVKHKNIQLIITNSFKYHVLSIFCRCLIRCTIIWRFREDLPKNLLLKYLILVSARFVPKKIITNSDYMRNQFIKNGIVSCKVETVYPGFVLKDFYCSGEDAESYKGRFGIKPDEFVVGCLGSLVKQKGQEYLIKATKLLKDKIPNLKVMIVGDKISDTDIQGTKESLIELTHHLKLDDIVIFTGFIKEHAKMLNILDLLVLTSISPETFGRVAVEGMLCGKAVIATAAGGILEIIKDGQTGRLVQAANPEELARVIEELYNNKKQRQEIAHSAKQESALKFNINVTVKKLESIYLFCM
ncbi:MAG: sugar transferase, partial [Candidatus Omnitrophica bacterium]|nr:sugar transferase [Candidatus Omnitrophota bacterium]